MSSLELEPNTPTQELDLEWRRLHDATMAARSHYQAVAERLKAAANLYEKALEHLEILEILEARSRAALETRRGQPERLLIRA